MGPKSKQLLMARWRDGFSKIQIPICHAYVAFAMTICSRVNDDFLQPGNLVNLHLILVEI